MKYIFLFFIILFILMLFRFFSLINKNQNNKKHIKDKIIDLKKDKNTNEYMSCLNHGKTQRSTKFIIRPILLVSFDF